LELPSIDLPPLIDGPELPRDPITLDAALVGRADTRPALADAAGEAVDLIASLPTPRPPSAPTKPLPSKTRLPAAEKQLAPPSSPVASPVATASAFTAVGEPGPSVAVTRDFSEKPTDEIAPRKPASRADDALISAPTRELGLRTERRPTTDDETTG